jgi:hypothetical protein
VPDGEPQHYVAAADVTGRFANADSGESLPVSVGDIWTPEGFGCFARAGLARDHTRERLAGTHGKCRAAPASPRCGAAVR